MCVRGWGEGDGAGAGPPAGGSWWGWGRVKAAAPPPSPEGWESFTRKLRGGTAWLPSTCYLKTSNSHVLISVNTSDFSNPDSLCFLR